MIKRLLPLAGLVLLAAPASAEAAKCLGQKADVIKRSGSISLPRYQAVMLTGSRVDVKATGASLATRKLKWKKGKCARPTRVSKRVDGFEGSRHGDMLTVSPDRSTSLLGRDGNDIFRARNGLKDSITTGGGGRGNKVFSDKKDKVTWGWGLAAF